MGLREKLAALKKKSSPSRPDIWESPRTAETDYLCGKESGAQDKKGGYLACGGKKPGPNPFVRGYVDGYYGTNYGPRRKA